MCYVVAQTCFIFARNSKEKMLEIKEAISRRHSVRSFRDVEVEEEKLAQLRAMMESANEEGGLNIQMVLNEPKAFSNKLKTYGRFTGVKNYFVLLASGDDADEKCGYYGEKLVLLAQQLGLNTCWVAATYSKVKGAFEVNEGEKIVSLIPFGYGTIPGVPHKGKQAHEVVLVPSMSLPQWFKDGVESALLAPTALNQQKFSIVMNGDAVSINPGSGSYTRIDAGIVQCHFEIATGIKPEIVKSK